MNAKAEEVTDNNPFSAPVKAADAASNAVSEAASQREFAEIQAAMTIAQKFPRDPAAAMQRILTSCQRPTLAEHALYSYNRGGSDVVGPSIRMAEALAQGWGNVQWGVRELDQRENESTVEAYAWDLETNYKVNKVFQVTHERHTKRGVFKLTDPRDIYETVANQGARRARACILAVIPGDVVDAAVKECDKTLRARVDVTPERLKAMIDTFEQYGVTREHIEKRLQRKMDTITPANFLGLGRIANSLRDGMSVASDWFEVAPAGKPTTEAPRAKAKTATEAPRANGKPGPATKAPQSEPALTHADIQKALDASGVPENALLHHFEVDCLESLPAAKLAAARDWIADVVP